MRWSFLLVLLLAACEEEANPPKRLPPAGFLEQAPNISLGGALFREKCAYCHGTVTEGRIAQANSYTPPPSDFTAPKYRTSDPAYLYWRIETGKQVEPFRSRGSAMPAWGPHFSEKQIWQLVAYLRTRSGP